MSDLGDALAAATGGDLGDALAAATGTAQAPIGMKGAFVEWLVFTPPDPGQGMNAESVKGFFEVDQPGELDETATRFLLVVWNYGPAAISIFNTHSGEEIAEVSPQSSFEVSGTTTGGVSAEALDY